MSGSTVGVTGLGCICSIGTSVNACAEALFAERRNPLPPSHFKSDHALTYPVYEIPGELPHIDQPYSGTVSRTNILALAACREALISARLTDSQLRDLRVGVCLGTTVGATFNSIPFYAAYREGKAPSLSPVSRFLSGNPAGVLARQYGLSGPCQTVVNACSSGTDAIGIGVAWIRAGICDVVIAGGADEISRVTYNGFIALMITDDKPCRPFDRDRKGLNLGEGGAVVVLESERSRARRGVAARALVRGYGAASDAYHLTAPRPDGAGLRRAITEAMREAAILPRDIAFVNAHGTGTIDNDRVESQVLHDLLPGVPFLSTKGYTGHTLGAAGAVEAVFTIVSIEAKRIPGNAGFSIHDPQHPCAPSADSRVIEGTIALSQSLAFGGHNSALVLEGCS